ncbi:GGDEF domain-containing protein [Caballeronia sordidicola]|uniref:GGDEF domain-containing protein n=1 Tax=Caballeronia sordidicola TaxID=196367 RepID=UPI001F386EB2|nr:GGDEF domain-containing protein [Caballeronia sordidicola]
MHGPFQFGRRSYRELEREQATRRVMLGTVVLVIWPMCAGTIRPEPNIDAFLVVLLYVVYGAASWLAVDLVSRSLRARLAVTTLLDQALVIWLLAAAPLSLPMMWVVFWFLIDSGCRFGKSTLTLSCASAVSGILFLALLSPWWIENRPVALGLALSVMATSFYLGLLGERLGRVIEQLTHQAGTDPLTGLCNRFALYERLEQAILATSTSPTSALMLIDLDGFKVVNDSYGHAVGDVLLQTFAGLLESRMRKVDTVARLGGDEFVVLARDIQDKNAVLAIAGAVHSALADMTSIQGHTVNVSASIGACMVSAPTDIAALLGTADRAMYRAKTLGAGRTVFSDENHFGKS